MSTEICVPACQKPLPLQQTAHSARAMPQMGSRVASGATQIPRAKWLPAHHSKERASGDRAPGSEYSTGMTSICPPQYGRPLAILASCRSRPSFPHASPSKRSAAADCLHPRRRRHSLVGGVLHGSRGSPSRDFLMAKAPPKGTVMDPLQSTTTSPPPSVSTCEPPRESRNEDRAPEAFAALPNMSQRSTSRSCSRAPWLLREVSWLTPPSNGVEIQLSNPAPASPAVDAQGARQSCSAR